MANFQALNKETHKDVKLITSTDVTDIKEQHIFGVVLPEFALAGARYPIAFIKEKEGDSYFPVTIMGLEPRTNLFVSEEGKWEGMYMPARYTHKPLVAIPNKEDSNLFAIAIDMDSDAVSDSEGELLFAEDGSETEYLETRKKALMSYVENEKLTKAFIDKLEEFDLLTAQTINVKVADKEYNLNGLFIVDEKKFNELEDEKLLELRQRGFLGPIFAHLGSLHQVTNLIQKQAAKLTKK